MEDPKPSGSLAMLLPISITVLGPLIFTHAAEFWARCSVHILMDESALDNLQRVNILGLDGRDWDCLDCISASYPVALHEVEDEDVALAVPDG